VASLRASSGERLIQRTNDYQGDPRPKQVSGPLAGAAADDIKLDALKGPFAIAAFVIAHIHLLTTVHSFVDPVRPMIAGFDEVDLSPEEDAYLVRDEPRHIRCPPRCRRARSPGGTLEQKPNKKPPPGV
jgi:hypothetical protein